MNLYNKETIYVRRNAQGDITNVFEGKPDRYYKVVDTVIKIDSGTFKGGEQDQTLSENNRRSS